MVAFPEEPGTGSEHSKGKQKAGILFCFIAMTWRRGSLPRVLKLAPLEMGGRIPDLWLCHQPLLSPESPSSEEPLPSYCSGEQRFPTWSLNLQTAPIRRSWRWLGLMSPSDWSMCPIECRAQLGGGQDSLTLQEGPLPPSSCFPRVCLGSFSPGQLGASARCASHFLPT